MKQRVRRLRDLLTRPLPRQVIFTRNATESINLVAYTWGRTVPSNGDVVMLTEMEHHSNLVPWQILAGEKNLRLEFIPVTEDGLLDLDVYRNLLGPAAQVGGFHAHVECAGDDQPGERDHPAGAPGWSGDAGRWRAIGAAFAGGCAGSGCGFPGIFGAQDVRTDRDWCACMEKELLEAMPPFLGGGDMIKRVHLRSFVPNELPA